MVHVPFHLVDQVCPACCSILRLISSQDSTSSLLLLYVIFRPLFVGEAVRTWDTLLRFAYIRWQTFWSCLAPVQLAIWSSWFVLFVTVLKGHQLHFILETSAFNSASAKRYYEYKNYVCPSNKGIYSQNVIRSIYKHRIWGWVVIKIILPHFYSVNNPLFTLF